MKKLIISAAIFPLTFPAFAQSNIQIYGALNANFQYGDVMGTNLFAINSTTGTGGPRIGFRGEEDLGSGFKAVFLLEQGFDISTGKSDGILPKDAIATSGSEVFTRQAYVGLKGSFGQITLGRHQAPGYYIYEFDGIPGVGSSALVQLTNLYNLTIQTMDRARWSNSLLYTGSYESISWSAIYSAGNDETDKYASDGKKVKYNDDDRFGMSVKYASGPLSATAIYHNVKYNSLNALGDKNQKEYMLGVSYDFGLAKLFATYQKGDNVSGHKDRDVDIWQIGSAIPVFGGRNMIRLSYAQSKFDPPQGKSIEPYSFTALVLHYLTKRTYLYLGYTQSDYDNLTWGRAAELSLAQNPFQSNNKKVEDSNLFFLGIQHNF